MQLEALQNGRYLSLHPVGSGSMGEVYLAEDTRIHRQVAIKVIRSEAIIYPDRSSIDDAARLFEQEARTIAIFNHPNILPLYDFGEERREDATITYMVMPYCPDGSLEGWLSRRTNRILPPHDVAHLLEQAAEALQFAHDHEMIHLDVKPSNFLIRTNLEDVNHPDLLLADFGIAKLSSATASVSHSIRGTPTYMAPEQWDGEPVYATDQYALAVLAYELLTGRAPFVGRQQQVMYQHLTVQPQPPSTLNPLLSKDVDAVLLKALKKKPEERFMSISAFANAFQQALQTYVDQLRPWLRERDVPETVRSTFSLIDPCDESVQTDDLRIRFSPEGDALFRAWVRRQAAVMGVAREHAPERGH